MVSPFPEEVIEKWAEMEKRKAIETETERLWKSVDNQTGEKGAKVGLTIDWQYLYIAVIYLLLGISQVCIQR